MRITLKLFASLRKKLPPGSPRGSCELDLTPGTTIAGLLERMDIPRASAQMVLLNGEQERNLDRPLTEGDIVSVFPPVAGG